ncbi:hypothetical protein AB4142_38265, partial [Variovorax sp. 2RAF20]
MLLQVGEVAGVEGVAVVHRSSPERTNPLPRWPELGWERTHGPAFFRLRRTVSALARDTSETPAAEKTLLAYVN